MSVRLAIAVATGGFVLSAGCGSQSDAPSYDSGADGPASSDASADDTNASDAITAAGQCSTNANPGGCNCPNSGAAHVYVLAVVGDPAACGLHVSPGDNSEDLCRLLCGGCFPQLGSLGSSCQLIGSTPSVQCNTICPPP